MFRLYHSFWQRFDQPDPYDGSYNLTDPQSLNRYAYVQNDPVNFVDPSGLNLEEGGGGWSCSGTWSGERTPSGAIVNFRITSISCQTWSYGGGGGGGGGSQQTGSQQTPDACGDMADFAQTEANKARFDNPNDPKAALRQFDRTFTTLYAGRPATSLISAGRQWINRGAGATQIRFHLGETGFRQEFLDTGQHAPGELVDQTHHFAFYLSMGVNENGSGALWSAQRAHRARDNQGDANLGRAGYEMGTGLRDNPGRLSDIGDMIRKAICNPDRKPAH